MERGGSIFPRTGKIFAPSSAHTIFLSLSLSFPLLFFSLDRFHRFSLRYRLFRLHIPKFHNPQRLSRVSLFFPSLPSSLHPSSLPFPPLAFRPTCIGKYESFVPSALSGTCICHGHTHTGETCSDRWERASVCVRACVRATVCSQVVTKIDRGGLVHGMKKSGESETQTEASLHQGVEDGQNGRVVRPNDDIPRLRSKFSQLTSRIARNTDFSKSDRCSLPTNTTAATTTTTVITRAQDDG